MDIAVFVDQLGDAARRVVAVFQHAAAHVDPFQWFAVAIELVGRAVAGRVDVGDEAAQPVVFVALGAAVGISV